MEEVDAMISFVHGNNRTDHVRRGVLERAFDVKDRVAALSMEAIAHYQYEVCFIVIFSTLKAARLIYESDSLSVHVMWQNPISNDFNWIWWHLLILMPCSAAPVFPSNLPPWDSRARVYF